jgi:hypothetical protein
MGLAMLATLTWVGTADAFHFCRAANGELRLRETCRRREVDVDPNVMNLQKRLSSTSFLVGVERVTAETPASSSTQKTIAVNCPEGTLAVGGGAVAQGVSPGLDTTGLALTTSAPTTAPEGWVAIAHEAVGVPTDWTLHVTALCARIGS